MKFMTAGFAASFLLLGSSLLPGQTSAAGTESGGQSAGPRIGFVDLGTITDKAKAQASTMDSLSGEVRRIQQDVQKKIDKMRDLEREIKKSEGIVSADEISAKRKEVNRLKDELDELEVKYKKQLQRMEETVFEPLVKKIGYAIEDEAKSRGIDIVLRGEAVFFGSDSVDLTDAVIKRLDMDSASTGTRSVARSTPKAKPTEAPSASERKETPKETTSASGGEASAPAKETPKPAMARVRPVDRQQDQ